MREIVCNAHEGENKAFLYRFIIILHTKPIEKPQNNTNINY